MFARLDTPPGHPIDSIGQRLKARRVGRGGGSVEHVDDHVRLGRGCVEVDERVAPLRVGERSVRGEDGGRGYSIRTCTWGQDGSSEEAGTRAEESRRMHVEEDGVGGGEEGVGRGQVRVGVWVEGGGDGDGDVGVGLGGGVWRSGGW